MNISISAYKTGWQQNNINIGNIIHASGVNSGRNGSFILNINGKNVEVFSKDLLYGNNIKLLVLKTNPLEVELLKHQIDSQFNNGDKLSVKVLSSNNGIFGVEINGKTYHTDILSYSGSPKIMAEVIKTDPFLILKEINTSPKQISLATMAEDIKKTLKNSGQFFEYELSKGMSVDGDMKLNAYIMQNNAAESAVNKL